MKNKKGERWYKKQKRHFLDFDDYGYGDDEWEHARDNLHRRCVKQGNATALSTGNLSTAILKKEENVYTAYHFSFRLDRLIRERNAHCIADDITDNYRHQRTKEAYRWRRVYRKKPRIRHHSHGWAEAQIINSIATSLMKCSENLPCETSPSITNWVYGRSNTNRNLELRINTIRFAVKKITVAKEDFQKGLDLTIYDLYTEGKINEIVDLIEGNTK